MRGQLRAGEPAPDQRAVRREPQPGAGGSHRGAHPSGGDRRRLLPGNPPGPAVRRVQRVLRAGQRSRAAAPGAGDGHARGAGPRRGRGGRGARRGVPRRRPVAPRSGPDPARPAGRPSGRAVAGGRRTGAERRQRRDHPGRGRLCRGARPADRAGRGAAGAGGARVRRQGVRGVRQSLRRGDDRADRVRLRVPGHGALRRAGHARHRLPLPAIPARRRAGGPGRRAGRADRQADPGAGAADRHGQGHGRRAAAAAAAQDGFTAPGPDDRALPARPRTAGQSWPPAGGTTRRCTRSTSPRRSTSSPPRTRSSPSTSARRPSGPPGTCG